MTTLHKYAAHVTEAITALTVVVLLVYGTRWTVQTASSAGIPWSLTALVTAPLAGAAARLARDSREAATRYRNWRDSHLVDLAERDTGIDDDQDQPDSGTSDRGRGRGTGPAESAGYPADEGHQENEQDDRNGRTESDPEGREAIEDGQRSAGATSTDRRDRGRYVAADEHERFWAQVDKDSHPRGCWVWTGLLTEDGYPRFTLADGSEVRAHRWAYEQLVGPIPDGLTIDHHDDRCRNRACVRPDHLEPVTRAENTRRAAAWRRANQETDQETPR